MATPPTRFTNDVEFAGSVTFTGDMNLPAGVVDDEDIAAGTNIEASKVVHRLHVTLAQKTGTDTAAETRIVFAAYKACEVIAVKIAAETAATGGDKKATIDVKKSTGGGAFSSILDSAYDMDNSKSDKTVYDATLSGTPTLAAGDLLEIAITVSGSTGSQNQGLIVDVILEEDGT